MKVILSEAVLALGGEGEVVDVAPGYARNYLLPRKLAVLATKSNLKVWEEKRQVIMRREHKVKDEAEAVAGKLGGLVLQLSAKAGREGRLYGAITAKDIAEAVHTEAGVKVDKKDVLLEEGIKEAGDFPVKIRLHAEVEAEVTLQVEAAQDGESEEPEANGEQHAPGKSTPA